MRHALRYKPAYSPQSDIAFSSARYDTRAMLRNRLHSMAGTKMSAISKAVLLLLLFGIIFAGEVCGYRSKHWRLGFSESSMKYKPRKPLQIEANETWIWPLPAEWTKGESTIILDPKLELVVQGGLSESDVLEEAFERYLGHIFVHQSAEGKKLRRKSSSPTLLRLVINLLSDNQVLQLGTDESYTLAVPATNESSDVYLEASNIYGALRGLETFSQLCGFNFETRSVEIRDAPWSIKDKPRFQYRGLLIDTARHYLPVETIRKVIDSMSYAKLNVLHWHIVDTESFPLEIPSYPAMWDGAYTKAERYTMEDAANIVEYARRRGINIMPELDTPGHAASWGVGYPQLWPHPKCQQPLDVSSKFTFEVIAGILADFRKVFPFDLMHLGGDEVDTSCWNQSEHIRGWLKDRNLTLHDAYATFVLEVQTITRKLGWAPVNWEEPFSEFGKLLSPDTVVHEWYSNNLVPAIVDQGFRCIVSNQDVWYLDHLDVGWEEFYLNEPLADLNSLDQQQLVLGGEVCMWGETADPGDIEATIWPRAAAAAERLWSSPYVANSTYRALPRLERFRCLLHERGVGAAPVKNYYAREGPEGPGSCYDQ
ncbi:hypothetical protein R1sor_005234 [Riccia sorocarpa]|uniref:Beta-hexosaminidase n=1 Tax=Riccia sorocarpa TaxID=122646 RepID=A0ABD3HJF8_9MARC